MKHCAKIPKLIFSILMMAVCLSSCSAVNASYFSQKDRQPSGQTAKQEDALVVQYLDVGQADAVLVTCAGSSMLIDGGNVADGPLVADAVTQSVTTLNYIVNTHAHEDHCGGLTQVVNSVPIENAIISSEPAETKCYMNFIHALETQSVYIAEAQAGMAFALGDAECTIIGPTQRSTDVNNTSVVVRLAYAGRVFLFMGDAESEEERSIIQAGYDVKCDVLKAGHHGSSTSSGYVFLREAQPEYAIISVGQNNAYGHPDADTLSRFRDAGCTVYRTDISGTITAVTDKNGNIQIYD